METSNRPIFQCFRERQRKWSFQRKLTSLSVNGWATCFCMRPCCLLSSMCGTNGWSRWVTQTCVAVDLLRHVLVLWFLTFLLPCALHSCPLLECVLHTPLLGTGYSAAQYLNSALKSSVVVAVCSWCVHSTNIQVKSKVREIQHCCARPQY